MSMSRHNKTSQTTHAAAAAAAAVDALTIKVASMANAVVKSSQEMGSLELRLVNSRTRIRMVTQKQKHHVNMHHVQKELVMWPTLATRLKVIQLKITSSIRMMPTGDTTALTFSATMTTSGCSSRTDNYSPRVSLKSSFLLVLLRQTAGADPDKKRKYRAPPLTTLSQSLPTMACRQILNR